MASAMEVESVQAVTKNSLNKSDENENDTASVVLEREEVDGDLEAQELATSGSESALRRARRRKRESKQPTTKSGTEKESGETESKRVRYSLRARPEPALTPQLVEYILHQPTAGENADEVSECNVSVGDLRGSRRNSRVRESLSNSLVAESQVNAVPASTSANSAQVDILDMEERNKSARRRSNAKRSGRCGDEDRRRRVKKPAKADQSAAECRTRRFAFAGDYIRDLLPAELARQWRTASAVAEAKRVLSQMQSQVCATALTDARKTSATGEKLSEIVAWLARYRAESNDACNGDVKLAEPSGGQLTHCAASACELKVLSAPRSVAWPASDTLRKGSWNCGEKLAATSREWHTAVMSQSAFLEAFGSGNRRWEQVESFTLVEHGAKIWPVKKQPDAPSGKQSRRKSTSKRKANQ